MDFLDAQVALNFVMGQTTAIEAQVNMTVYPDIQYPELVPIDTSAHPFAKTVTFFSGDMNGKADWLNANADDVPIAGSDRTKYESSIYSAGVGYAYGFEEIGQAQMLGRNLPNEDAMAARRAYEEMCDRVFILGDAKKGLTGLVNSAAITPVAATTGNWATATFEQIVADFNQGLRASWSGTAFTSIADTVLLPNLIIDILASRIVPNSTMTILQFLRTANTYTNTTGRQLTIRGVRGLETAGAGSTKRMISYRRDPSVVKAHMPMPHRFLQPRQASAFRIEVPGVFRLGGTDIRRPKEVAYTDGL